MGIWLGTSSQPYHTSGPDSAHDLLQPLPTSSIAIKIFSPTYSIIPVCTSINVPEAVEARD